ncbi:hypothetical protein AB4245_26125, partial [Vibrio splendidus]
LEQISFSNLFLLDHFTPLQLSAIRIAIEACFGAFLIQNNLCSSLLHKWETACFTNKSHDGFMRSKHVLGQR